MDKAYSPQQIEAAIYARWEAGGYFAAQGDGPAYCIMIPPPNVTGTLHMGHAFQHTLMDILTRVQRMRGACTLWQPGTDHAGIATQMVVERQLEAQGVRRSDLSREAFIERVWQWKQQSGGTISAQMRRLGDSVDWQRERFTMDTGLSQAVIEAFVRLYQEGLIYRGKRLVNWDPVLLTAVSDLEVQNEPEDGHLWHLRYPLVDGSGHVVVATTRPETLLGDSAVAVHPEDARYQHWIGREVELPLTGRRIPIIADAYVDPEFGSGCVKITPAHDFNDYEVGLRHNLPQLNIFTPQAALNDAAPQHLRGLDRFAARIQIIAELETLGLVERIEKHQSVVPRGDRSGAVLEPYLTDQWYVKTAPLAAPAIAAVASGRTRFIPENWSKIYFDWLHNIRDWCISRQLWWGHRIPAWYGPDGAVYVGRSEAEVRQQYKLAAEVLLYQDDDVLDTWFSSALWPFSTLGWPQQNADLTRFYPSTVLVTGFDIIFFWVARMMMFGLKFMNDVPFREVYITGLIRDENGEKMSKSKGNVLDPLDIVDGIELEALVTKRTSGLMQPKLKPKIEKLTRQQFPQGIAAYGTDALRFTFAALSSPSRDIRFDLGRVGGYRNFCNKLWNAARFVSLLTENADANTDGTTYEYSVADRWIRARFGQMLREVDEALAQYRFDYAATALYEFAWYEFCDWYLELTKVVLQSPDSSAAARAGTRATLIEVLEALQRALHPFMPFITEAIWQRLTNSTDCIMVQPYPAAAQYAADDAAQHDIAWLKKVILGLRQIRGEMDISPSRQLAALVCGATTQDTVLIKTHWSYLQRLAGVESLLPIEDVTAAPHSASAMVEHLTLLVPMAGLINPQVELQRLQKRLAKAQEEWHKAQRKLGNDSFVQNAPPAVVEQERDRVNDFARTISGLQQQLAKVQQLLTEPAS
jgi:valyl-tRNA synthetase